MIQQSHSGVHVQNKQITVLKTNKQTNKQTYWSVVDLQCCVSFRCKTK